MAKYYGRQQDKRNPPKSHDNSIVYTLSSNDFGKSEPIAKAKWTASDGFLLLKGSLIRRECNCLTNKSIKPIQTNILKDKSLQDSFYDDYYVLTEDILVSSPSSSACLVYGNDRNGQGWVNNKLEGLPIGERE